MNLTDSVEIHQWLMKPRGKQSLTLSRPTFVEQRVQTLALTTAYDRNTAASHLSQHGRTEQNVDYLAKHK